MAQRSPWAATYIRWQDESACRGSAFDFIPDQETPKERAFVESNWCNVCPVRTECLLYALLHREQGYWGGTDTSQRRRLNAKKNRAKCPVCSSRNLVRTHPHEVCLSCGLSWTKGKPPVPKPKRRLASVPNGEPEGVTVPERYL